MTQDNKNCVEQLLILLLFFLKSITNEQNDDDHSRQTKRENDNPWQQHCAKRLIVKKTKKKEEKESLQPSASTDDIRNKQILCDLVCWQWCMTTIITYVIYSYEKENNNQCIPVN
jgi:hypothetical protein